MEIVQTPYPKPMPAGLMARLVRRSRRSKAYCSRVYNGSRTDALVAWIIEQELAKLTSATEAASA